jgi:hypothetical protein
MPAISSGHRSRIPTYNRLTRGTPNATRASTASPATTNHVGLSFIPSLPVVWWSMPNLLEGTARLRGVCEGMVKTPPVPDETVRRFGRMPVAVFDDVTEVRLVAVVRVAALTSPTKAYEAARQPLRFPMRVDASAGHTTGCSILRRSLGRTGV